MPRNHHSTRRIRPELPFILLVALLVILWVSGGSSRADVLGQVITRGSTWAILIVYILWARRPQFRQVAPVAYFVLAATVLTAVQLIPLPPSIWTALPGRELLEQAATVSGQAQPWRPLSISPGATANALSALIVPIVTLLLMAALSLNDQWRIASILLGLIVASSLLGLVQFSGGRFDHPFINDVAGMVSASFANRNHFALFAAIGCVLAPAWGFREESKTRWKQPVAIALLLLFAMIILASGSRMGALVGALGIGLGLLNVRNKITSELRRLPRPVAITIVALVLALIATAIILSVTLGRALSFDRAVTLELSEDLRRRALPTVWAMTQYYFPFGSGLGTFDPVYRIHEPDQLLNTTYFNHAHNDLIEVVLDAGLAGLLLLGGAIVWWFWKSVSVWRSGSSTNLLRRLGSAILFLILLASITDYPARTPMIMAVLVIAAVWLNGTKVEVLRQSSALADRRSTETHRDRHSARSQSLHPEKVS